MPDVAFPAVLAVANGIVAMLNARAYGATAETRDLSATILGREHGVLDAQAGDGGGSMRGTCETCDFWAMGKNEEVTEVTDHECHRYPPSVPMIRRVNDLGVECHLLTPNDDSTYMTYPRTFSDQWCGEWRPREWEPICR